MAWFTVQYRGPGGKTESVQIDAADRAGVFAELKKRGITTVIRVEQFKGKVSVHNVKPAQLGCKSASMFKWVVAGAVIVIGVFVALYFLSLKTVNAPERQAEKQTNRPPKGSKPISLPLKVEPAVITEDQERARRREMFRTMSYGEKMDYLYKKAQEHPLRTEPGTNRIFRTGTEQVMDWIFRCELGDPPPLLPKLPIIEQAHLAEILVSDNPISDDDSDSAKDAKEIVALAKKEFIKYLKAGGDPDDFLPYYHGLLVQANNEWKMARKAVVETVKENPDIAIEFLDRVNKDLEAKGIKKVTLPPKMLELYGVEVE